MKKIFTVAFATLAFVASACAAPKAERQVAIVAHRGFWNSAVGGGGTNSIASLKAAQEEGFWGSEFDVNMTKDRELVVFHDEQVAGMPFLTHNWEDFKDIRIENGEPIPTLDEYLTQAEKNKKTRLVFELKWHPDNVMEECVDLCIEKLKAHGLFDPKQVIFISFSIRQCELFVEKCPGFTVQFLHYNMTPDEVFARGVNGEDMYFPKFREFPDWYKDCRKNGMSVNVWTVDNVKDMKDMVDLGVDYITTNNPEKCRTLLKKMGVKELKAGKNF